MRRKMMCFLFACVLSVCFCHIGAFASENKDFDRAIDAYLYWAPDETVALVYLTDDDVPELVILDKDVGSDYTHDSYSIMCYTGVEDDETPSLCGFNVYDGETLGYYERTGMLFYQYRFDNINCNKPWNPTELMAEEYIFTQDNISDQITLTESILFKDYDPGEGHEEFRRYIPIDAWQLPFLNESLLPDSKIAVLNGSSYYSEEPSEEEYQLIASELTQGKTMKNFVFTEIGSDFASFDELREMLLQNLEENVK